MENFFVRKKWKILLSIKKTWPSREHLFNARDRDLDFKPSPCQPMPAQTVNLLHEHSWAQNLQWASPSKHRHEKNFWHQSQNAKRQPQRRPPKTTYFTLPSRYSFSNISAAPAAPLPPKKGMKETKHTVPSSGSWLAAFRGSPPSNNGLPPHSWSPDQSRFLQHCARARKTSPFILRGPSKKEAF